MSNVTPSPPTQQQQQQQQQQIEHSIRAANFHAFLYVLSGCCQPLLMTVATNAGLANPVAQVYMLFYYLGPSLLIIPMIFQSCKNNNSNNQTWPSQKATIKGIGISLFGTVATSMNYAGASLAGPTIFSIVYSSVTIWTAIFSQLFLGRKLNMQQWVGVCIVFGGLTLTATDSLQLGPSVVRGLLLVMFGSAMNSMTYIFCEAVMTIGEDRLSVQQSCVVQAGTACMIFLSWQLFYVLPRKEEFLLDPMEEAGTTFWYAVGILSIFSFANLIHYIAFYETLIKYPGGATSAGVFKGLQAVLVFVATHVAFCGRIGGKEMCFTGTKLISLVTVVGGVLWYGMSTSPHGSEESSSLLSLTFRPCIYIIRKKKGVYESIERNDTSIELESLSSRKIT